MKPKRNQFRNLLAIASIGGWMVAGTGLLAQETPERHAAEHTRHDAAPSAEARYSADRSPEAGNIRRMMRELEELKRAGKREEAQKMAGRIRVAAGGNPQVQEALRRAMGDSQQGAGVDHRNDNRMAKAPEKPDVPARMKIQKLREAAGLLQSAGYSEQAAKARAEIGRIEGNLHREESEAKMHKTDKPHTGRPGDAGPVVAELRKLRRDLEELRGEVRRMKAKTGKRLSKKRRKMERPGDGVH